MTSKSDAQLLLGTVKPNPNVIFRRLDDQIVLFHLGSDRFYELNSTAARFWELLNEGHDDAYIRDQMLSEFAVDRKQLSAEAEALLQSLKQEDLISVDE
jgi:Coenzyme PQQ synthesis protein D (PqqD)